MSDAPDILAPESRHNLHVTGRSDLRDVGDWSAETLYQAVKAADAAGDHVVVLDYGRSNIYLCDPDTLTYHPPKALGLEAPATLALTEPERFDPTGPKVVPHEPVEVAPEFDILIPAFDWDELTEDDILPPTHIRSSDSPTGAGTGTPG